MALRTAALALALTLLGACSLVVDPPRLVACPEGAPPRCDGDRLILCEAEWERSIPCGSGCVDGGCVEGDGGGPDLADGGGPDSADGSAPDSANDGGGPDSADGGGPDSADGGGPDSADHGG